MKMNDEIALVSIIIPTYNSGKTIAQCLESIQTQTHKSIETLIIDGGSTDNTLKIAENFGCKIFVLNGKERSPSINFGVKKSIGEYIYRVDSDVIIDSNLVKEALYKCEVEGYDAISVFWSPDSTISFWAKVRKLEKDCYKEELLYSGARFFRRDVFESIGGFDENLVAGEDYDLYNRLAKMTFKIGIIESQELHIGEPKSIVDIIKKNYYYGKTLNYFITQNKMNGVKQLSPMRGPLLKNWKKFVTHPVLLIGFIVYEILIYSSSIVGLVVSIIKKELSKTSSDK